MKGDYDQWVRRIHWNYERGRLLWKGKCGPGWVRNSQPYLSLTERGIRRKLARKIAAERRHEDRYRRSSA